LECGFTAGVNGQAQKKDQKEEANPVIHSMRFSLTKIRFFFAGSQVNQKTVKIHQF
jgi:hypothetical protein